jgi:hypothetical protein
MREFGLRARFKNILKSDIAMVAFLLTAVAAAYSLGGVPSLTLIVLVIAILAVFVSLAKGPDVLIVYSVFALFFTAVAFVAGHVTGLVISLLVTVFLASRGIVNIKLNRNSIATLAAMIAAISLAYVLLPGYYPLLVAGAASIALFGLLVWAGKISPYTLKLVFLRPSEGFQVLRMKVRASWEQATQALERQPSVEAHDERHVTAEGEVTGSTLVETASSASENSQPLTVRPSKESRISSPPPEERTQKKTFDAVIDGSNVAYGGGSEATPTLRNVALVANRLSELGLSWVVIVDASLRHKLPQGELPSECVMTLTGENVSLTERETLARAIWKERVYQAPAWRPADEFILEFARKWNAVLISNDSFQNYWENFPDVLTRRVTFLIIEGEVVFKPDPLEVLKRLRGPSATERANIGSNQQKKYVLISHSGKRSRKQPRRRSDSSAANKT